MASIRCSSTPTKPTVSTTRVKLPCSTLARRTPRFSTTRESTAILPGGAAPTAGRVPPTSVDPGSAYLGTNCISMNGDLPGLSKCSPGCIGSYQYCGLLSAGAVATPAAEAPPWGSGHFGTNCMSMKGDLPGLSKCSLGRIGSYQ